MPWLMTMWAVLATAGPLPPIAAETLSGDAVRLPEAMPATHTILVLGFKQSHQDDFDRWRPTLAGLASDEVAWLELPFLDVPGFLKGLIGGAMNRQLDDPVQRAHFAPVWASPDPVQAALGIPTDELAVLVVLGPDHGVVFRHDGPPTEQAVADLRAALGEGDP